jgi:phosphoribosylamine--glycine ligase
MRVMIVGSGGREHALAWKIRESPRTEEVYVVPGNGGTKAIAHNLPISAHDISSLLTAAKEYEVDLTVVGPEGPLASGIVNAFQEKGRSIFGPTREGTLIESSKAFCKMLLSKYAIPQAKGTIFTDFTDAARFIREVKPPLVIKADGLAGGKGVTIASSSDEALIYVSDLMQEGKLGDAGKKVIVEEYLEGREVSLLAFSDGHDILPLVPACDYKRAYDQDQGPNTGGMGSYSPPRFFDDAEAHRATEAILRPVVRAMNREGREFRGVLYAGLMVTSDGPKVLEFNARFGDPETQVILPRLKSDLTDIMLATVQGRLDDVTPEWDSDACVGVVMASGGYPQSYTPGLPIAGLDRVDEDIMVFQGGTVEREGELYTNGGRVLTVVGRGKDVAEARQRVYSNVNRIQFEGCYYRQDIGLMA